MDKTRVDRESHRAYAGREPPERAHIAKIVSSDLTHQRLPASTYTWSAWAITRPGDRGRISRQERIARAAVGMPAHHPELITPKPSRSEWRQFAAWCAQLWPQAEVDVASRCPVAGYPGAYTERTRTECWQLRVRSTDG